MGIENWELIEDGIGYAETLATCAEEALVIAKTRINPKDYPDRPHYVVVEVVCHGTGGYGREVVVMQPAPPLCVGEAKHDWRQPHSVVGGRPERPGVFGEHEKTIYCHVCANCGWYRTRDLYAVSPEGLRGDEEIAYSEPDPVSRAWLAGELEPQS